MQKRYIWLGAAVLWCIAIFIASGSTTATGGSTQMLLAKLFNLSEAQAVFFNVLFRKTVHLSAFGLLAILFYNGFDQKRPWLSWSLTTLYAASDEIHQAFLPDRTGAIFDVGLDSLGAVLALAIMTFWKRKRGD
ncbi:VanZ family protein [Bacillus sp. FJAT-50079]|uniref:VanZ family protein n=1 Tax=Bacillus sp. FJAT-50079 TaxID=2833577 RepID=UPI001BC94CA7|nr:VanZ family protein [Bacillus sp. FJAT-50079]MBS4208263.1 VanZ family protein [Bacillus sp. FJAT-50079]